MTAIKEKEATSRSASVPQPRECGRGVTRALSSAIPTVALLTGGDDKPYVVGLAEALTTSGISIDLIGSDDLLCDQLLNNPQINFLNLRGNQRHDASFAKKVLRIAFYYIGLIRYVATAQPKILHILWNNKFQVFDRTLLMLFYKLLGKKIVFTAHNVNAGRRDGNDSFLNRLTLKIQYALSAHIFVHTKAMKEELKSDFNVPDKKVSVIPFGINNTIPNTELKSDDARREFGLDNRHRIMLFFGRIVPYKGLEYLIEALGKLANEYPDLRLIVAGATNRTKNYWQQIQQTINRTGMNARIIQRIEFIPDEETELFFKAADVLILPYANIFQTGLLFLAYSFGLPAIVTDVGSLKEDVIEGKTGFVSAPKDSAALANVIDKYFSSELYENLESRRKEIQEYANERYSWCKVAAVTTNVYSQLREDVLAS
jgi:D-inositol-3-phosphate glycosyltransferase